MNIDDILHRVTYFSFFFLHFFWEFISMHIATKVLCWGLVMLRTSHDFTCDLGLWPLWSFAGTVSNQGLQIRKVTSTSAIRTFRCQKGVFQKKKNQKLSATSQFPIINETNETTKISSLVEANGLAISST